MVSPQNPQTSPRLFDRSLRSKVTLGVVLPLILILGTFTVIEYPRRRAAVLANLALLATQTGQVIESSLQNEMLSQNREAIQRTPGAIGGGGEEAGGHLFGS